MTSFSPSRFFLVLKRDVLENRTGYLRLFAGIYLGCLGLQFGHYFSPSLNGPAPGAAAQTDAVLAERMAVSMLTFFSLVLVWFLAQMLSNYRTQALRTTNLLLPATNAEKYLSRLLLYTVGALLLLVVSYVAADVTRVALFPLLGHSYGLSLGATAAAAGRLWHGYFAEFGVTYSDGTSSVWPMLLLTFMTLWSYSCYVLGSAVFRRRPFLFTTLSLLALLVLLGLSVNFVDDHFTLTFTSEHEVKTRFLPATACVFAALTGLNHWLAYRLFCRIQIIPRKWLRK